MGLDYTELIMQTEDTFGIEITDQECYHIITPQNLIDSIISKIDITKKTGCTSHRAFNILRGVLIREYSVPREEVKLESSLFDLIEIEDERGFWRSLKENMRGTMWPELLLPKARIYGKLSLYLLVFSAICILASPIEISLPFIVILYTVLLLLLEVKLYKPLSKYRNRINREHAIIKRLLPSVITSRRFLWKVETIEEEVKELVQAKMGKPEEYQKESHFFKHLGLE